MQVYIDNDKVKSISNNVKQIGNDLNNCEKKLRNILEEISSNWEGEDSKKFQAVMNSKTIAKVQEMADLVNDYAKYLGKVPNAYQNLDSYFSGKKIDS